MAAWNIPEDQSFNCAVCLEILRNPVTINCGHNFCMSCINSYWDVNNHTGVYSCPQCRETFSPRPVLRKNNLLTEMVEKQRTPISLSDCVAGPGEAECDYCTGRKHKAIKSCLMCMVSLCETHLKPHEDVPALKTHNLINAVSQLQEMICKEHNKLMEIYCRTDQCCICYLCTVDKHKGHQTVSAVAERYEKQGHVKEAQAQWQQLIQEQEWRKQVLQLTAEKIKNCADDAVMESEMSFSLMISLLETKRSEVTELIRAQEKSELKKAEKLLKQTEQEISNLKKRHSNLEKLSKSHDHVHFLKSYSSLSSPSLLNTSNFTVNQLFSFDEVNKAVSDLQRQVEDLVTTEFNRITPIVQRSRLLQPEGERNQTLQPLSTLETIRANFRAQRHQSRSDLQSVPRYETGEGNWTWPARRLIAQREPVLLSGPIGRTSLVTRNQTSVHPHATQSGTFDTQAQRASEYFSRLPLFWSQS